MLLTRINTVDNPFYIKSYPLRRPNLALNSSHSGFLPHPPPLRRVLHWKREGVDVHRH